MLHVLETCRNCSHIYITPIFVRASGALTSIMDLQPFARQRTNRQQVPIRKAGRCRYCLYPPFQLVPQNSYISLNHETHAKPPATVQISAYCNSHSRNMLYTTSCCRCLASKEPTSGILPEESAVCTQGGAWRAVSMVLF